MFSASNLSLLDLFASFVVVLKQVCQCPVLGQMPLIYTKQSKQQIENKQNAIKNRHAIRRTSCRSLQVLFQRAAWSTSKTAWHVSSSAWAKSAMLWRPDVKRGRPPPKIGIRRPPTNLIAMASILRAAGIYSLASYHIVLSFFSTIGHCQTKAATLCGPFIYSGGETTQTADSLNWP